MEAQDANNVTGPGKTLTDHARIKIVTESEKRTELAERTNDALSSLDQVGQSEDDLARALGTLIFQSPDAGNP
jgi:K+/H+ antiporter YhaU regulatory subunit KhtT